IPLAVHDHEVDIGAVVAGSIREDTHNRVIRTDAGSHCSLRMASDKVELIRFIERRGQSHSLVEKLDGRSKEIAKDARDRQDKVDARASESLERNSLDLHHTVEIVALRSYTKQPERLSDGLTLSLDVIEPPKDHRDALGVSASFAKMAFEQRF